MAFVDLLPDFYTRSDGYTGGLSASKKMVYTRQHISGLTYFFRKVKEYI